MSSLVSAHTRSTPRSSDPLTVLVIGPSQNGKATFINRIIQLAVNKVPFGKEGDGNFKCTTNCGVYDLAIPLTDYFLRDKATGKEYDVPDITDEEEILKDAWWRKQTAVKYGIEPCRPNAPTVSIRLIDTPGLDDSDNSKEAEKTAMMGGNAQQVRVVDERHKFSILRAMANSGRIHTVCFVLDICSNLGATIQSQHRQALPVQCTQTPCGDTGDEISVHFSKWGLSGLLRSISRQRSQAIIHLNSPKSDAQRVMDDILKMTLKTQESEWTSEISALEAQRNLWASTKRDVDSRASGELTSWRKIHAQAAELDKTTFVQVGFQEKHERAHFFNRSRLLFSVYASSPIRHFELEKSTEDGGCHWSSEPSRDDTIGKVSCDANLISWSSGIAIWGKIRLMGWVKEAKADELKVLHEEENEAWKDYTATIDRAQVLQDNIDQANTKTKDLRKRIKTFQAQYECLSLDHIPMETLKKTGQYLASSGIISYAYGLGININLSKRFILNTSPINGDQREVFEGKQKADCRRRRTCARAVKSLKGDERIQSEWAAKVADSDASIAAASHVLMILSHESLFLGVLAALRESAQNKRPNQSEDVYQQLKEVYYCDAQRWGEYEAKVYMGPTTSF